MKGKPMKCGLPLIAIAICSSMEFGCGSTSDRDSSQAAPVPIRVEDNSANASKPAILALSGGTDLLGAVLQVELSYPSARPGSTALNSCMTRLEDSFELGTVYCGADRGTSQSLTGGMVNQFCDGNVIQGASVKFPDSIQACASQILVEAFQFSPALVVSLRQ